MNGPRSGLASARAAGSVKRPIALAPTGRLVAAALSIGLFLGLVFTAPMPLWAGQPTAPPPAGAPAAPGIGWPGVLLALGFVLALVVPFRPYWQALALTAGAGAGSPRSVAPSAVVWLTAGLALVALLMYPRYGSDVFDYLGFERLWVVYGDNPLLGLPAAHPQDWSTPFVWFRHQPPAYGPLWAALTWPLVWLAGDSAERAVLGYKLLALVGYVACCRLVWLSVAPPRRPRALVLFGWSPLVLFEVLGKAHNDVLVALATLAAIWLLTNGRPAGRPVGSQAAGPPVGSQAVGLPVGGQAVGWPIGGRPAGPSVARPAVPAWASLPLAVLGGLVKLSALAVLPVLLVGLWQRRPRWPLALGALVAAGLLVAAYAPFWAGPATLQPIWHQTGRLVWSPATLLILLLGDEQATPVRLLAGLVWLLALAGLLKRTHPEPPQPVPLATGRTVAAAEDPSAVPGVNVVGSAGWSVVLSVLLLSTAVYAHYLVPVVALAAVADDARLERATLWLSIGALAAYGTEVLGVAIGSAWLGSPGYRLVGSLLLLGPALAAVVAPVALDRLRSLRALPSWPS